MKKPRPDSEPKTDRVRPMPRDMARYFNSLPPAWAVPPASGPRDPLNPVNGRIRIRSRDIRGLERANQQAHEEAEDVRKRLEEYRETDIRRDRKELFRVRTKIQLKQALETLENYQEKSPQTVQIEGLENVALLIIEEVVVTRGTSNVERNVAYQLALDEIRKKLEPSLKKGGRFRVGLKPGYEEIAQKELAKLSPGPALLEALKVFLKLNTIGYIITEEIQGG